MQNKKRYGRKLGKSLELGFIAKDFLKELGTGGEAGMIEKMKNSPARPLGYYDDTKEFKARDTARKLLMEKQKLGEFRCRKMY